MSHERDDRGPSARAEPSPSRTERRAGDARLAVAVARQRRVVHHGAGARSRALVVGGLLIALADAGRRTADVGYFFAYPWDTFSAGWDAIWAAYMALFEGAIFDPATLPASGTLHRDLRRRSPRPWSPRRR